MKKVMFTGGGTAGHVTPNIALFESLKKRCEIAYIGRKSGIEKELITKQNVPYFSISSGKLRRYIDVKNISDLFRIAKGVGDAVQIIRKEKPDVIFSKGGFVTVPVIIAGKILGIKSVIHESDYTPGLANKIAIPFASKVCVSFEETLKYLPRGKGVLTGSPIRNELFLGEKDRGLKITSFNDKKPIILVMGGSLGAKKINEVLRESLPKLLESFQIIHLCGKGNLDSKIDFLGYKQFEYVGEELPHLFKISDLVVSRAGANSIFELLALRKPNLLIPLSKKASRGDQILNANSFKKEGFSKVIDEDEMTSLMLISEIKDLYENRLAFIENMKKSKLNNGTDNVIKILSEFI